MAEDPIVQEIHKIREDLLNQYGGFDGYMRHLRELQEELKGRIVTRDPRPPATPSRKVS